jgi:glucosamine-6-phosphate deaminase
MEKRTYGVLQVTIFPTDVEMGRAAALELANTLRQETAGGKSASVILATGNSQLCFYEALRTEKDIPWNRVSVFHMDEYVGMSDGHSASFRRYMHEKLVDAVKPRAFYGIRGDGGDVDAEIARYTKLLAENGAVACVMGIGENGHLAFNDPPVEFSTSASIHLVRLAETARRQQVGEGHFESLADVPKEALTLTIPELLKPPHVLVVVPELRKAQAVKAALEGPITPSCPASILQTSLNAHLYLDSSSASLLA